MGCDVFFFEIDLWEAGGGSSLSAGIKAEEGQNCSASRK